MLKVISSVKQDRRQVPEMRYQRFFFYFVAVERHEINQNMQITVR